MRKIIKLFISDAKRLSSNVVAVVVIIGLSVIPCLYAWFNILSNWDPYGEAATSQLMVAVANADKGTSFDGKEVNIGDMIVSNLKENKSIGWVFTETPEDAKEGVYAGDYYAALVVDEDFSDDMISFLGGKLQHPQIIYYENDKKNAIAPKITGKVKTTVQSEVNKAFVSTLAEVMLRISGTITTTSTGEDMTSTALDKLHDMDDDLTTCITIIDSYISLIDTTNSLMTTTETVSDELESLMNNGQSMANAAHSATDATKTALDSASDMVEDTLGYIQAQMGKTDSAIDDLIVTVNEAGITTAEDIELLKISVDATKNLFDSTMAPVAGRDANVDENIKAVNADFEVIYTDLDNISNESVKTSQDAQEILLTLQKDLSECTKQINTLTSEYKKHVKPQLNNTMTAIQSSLSEVEKLLNYSSDSIRTLSSILHSYPDMMSYGKDNLASTKEEVGNMQKELRRLITDVEDLESNDQYKMLMKLIETDPAIISDFISEPVDLKQQAMYEMKNNGSATAPFYIVLSIWVGGLILVAIMKTQVKPIAEIGEMKNHEQFFGRYIVFYLIGQLQTIITVFGVLFYVGIQCKHPVLLAIACSITSLTFTFFQYALTYAFGSVGEAVAVILMVVQVAGSGGTFPVEVLPKVFQVLYNYMPFMYGMNAIRETIGGMYKNNYIMYLSGLLIYIAISVFIGVVLAVPAKKMNERVEKSLKETDVMG